MTIEYRPARADEFPLFVYTDMVGFGTSTSDDELRMRLDRTLDKPEMTLCAFEDGLPVAQMATFPFTMRWNGRDIGCGGVTSVSTLPSHRRRGHLRTLMTQAYADMRAANQPVAMLWASMAAIYQRFGYGIAFTRWVHTINPRELRFVDDLPAPGRVRLVKSTAALSRIKDVYDRFAAPRPLMLHRTQEMWEKGVLVPWRPDMAPFLVAVYEEEEHPLGYAVYMVERRRDFSDGPPLTLTARELIWETPAAHRALVQFLAGYDLAHEVTLMQLPVDDPLFYQVQEPRGLKTAALDGTLVRIVDVPAALEGRGYDADGRITFTLADEMCPWNAGTWELTVEGGQARVCKTQTEAALCLTPRALAMLSAGYVGATLLARNGNIAPADPRSLAAADALFRTAHAPLCTDMF